MKLLFWRVLFFLALTMPVDLMVGVSILLGEPWWQPFACIGAVVAALAVLTILLALIAGFSLVVTRLHCKAYPEK
jgi:hypothetical protein